MDDSNLDVDSFYNSLIGRRLNGAYLIRGQLGVGGMGAVFKAVHLAADSQIAIKVISPLILSNDNDRRRFLREARAGIALNHPNIIKVYEYGETEDGVLFMAMEFVEGRTLTEAVAFGRFTAARCLNLFGQLCRALDYAHSSNILHRDLKSENILIFVDDSGKETLKLADFGIMKLLEKDEWSTSGADLTDKNTVIGTPDYMSPEQLMNHDLTPASDVYGAGVVLHEMLTSELPFEYFSFSQLVKKKIYEELPPPSLKYPFITPAIDAVLLKAMSPDPERRYKSASELFNAYKNAVNPNG